MKKQKEFKIRQDVNGPCFKVFVVKNKIFSVTLFSGWHSWQPYEVYSVRPKCHTKYTLNGIRKMHQRETIWVSINICISVNRILHNLNTLLIKILYFEPVSLKSVFLRNLEFWILSLNTITSAWIVKEIEISFHTIYKCHYISW